MQLPKLLLSFLLITILVPNLINSGLQDDDVLTVEIDPETGEVKQAKPPKQRPKRKKTNPHSGAMGIKIKNPREYTVDYYWWSGTEAVYQGKMHPHGVTATNSYLGHTFFFTPFMENKPTNPLDFEFARIHIIEDVNLYILPPEKGQENDPFYLKLMEEKRFTEEYLERTGRPWLAHYPRDPPIHHIWSADYIGQIHTIITNETHWTCMPENNPPTEEEELNCHRSPLNDENASPLEIQLEVLSTEPKIFLIKHTLSEIESQLIMDLAKPKIKRSLAGSDGGLVSNTRTSSNAWLGRKEHYILDTIYKRAANIVNISEQLFIPGKKGNIVEDMQVVNYQHQQEYTPHHDFGADGRPQQRFITLLFYLNDLITSNAGGETSFPKANDGDGYKIHPGRGNSVMFYSILEDGNADDLSLHAGTPVLQGEKWICNFWVWDPRR